MTSSDLGTAVPPTAPDDRAAPSAPDPHTLARADPRLTAVPDPADPRLGDYAALTDAALRKRYEHRTGVLIAEGPTPVRQLLTSPYPLRSVLLTAERVADHADIVAAARAAAPPAPVFVTTRAALTDLVRFRLHQGVLACGERRPEPSPAAVLAGAKRILVLEGLNDHENLGALYRSARGLGADAVLLGPGCADPLYRRSVRVSMGHVLHVPTARVVSLTAAFASLRAIDAVVVALTPQPPAVDLAELHLPPDRPVALLLGAEGPGLSSQALAGADVRVRIPLAAAVDSLNVGIAGAIALERLRYLP